MLNNMPEAVFSITGYFFDKVNIDLANKPNDEVSLTFTTKGVFKRIDSSYNLSFLLKVYGAEETPSFIEVNCHGLFKFKNVTSIESIPEFFYNNSIAILFPYVRSYVSIITTQANIPGIILPTLNLSSLGEELKRNTIIE